MEGTFSNIEMIIFERSILLLPKGIATNRDQLLPPSWANTTLVEWIHAVLSPMGTGWFEAVAYGWLLNQNKTKQKLVVLTLGRILKSQYKRLSPDTASLHLCFISSPEEQPYWAWCAGMLPAHCPDIPKGTGFCLYRRETTNRISHVPIRRMKNHLPRWPGSNSEGVRIWGTGPHHGRLWERGVKVLGSFLSYGIISITRKTRSLNL